MRLERRLDATPAGWAEVALADPAALLSDHAHCEKKAALTALALINRHPGRSDLVTRVAALAAQEADHLRRVLEAMRSLGYALAPDHGNPYARALMAQVGNDLRDHLLAAAMIEARSHERLALLRTGIAARDDLRHLEPLFDELVACEAGHAHTYMSLAASIDSTDFEAAVSTWIARETDAISSVRFRPAVH